MIPQLRIRNLRVELFQKRISSGFLETFMCERVHTRSQGKENRRKPAQSLFHNDECGYTLPNR